jgi:hypothetical protein
MTATVHGTPAEARYSFWRRQLDHYPDTRPRMTYLGIVVLATIALYYAFYIRLSRWSAFVSCHPSCVTSSWCPCVTAR